MAIDITVEDGTGVATANSFVSVADARAYSLNRGITLPADDDTVAAWLIVAGDWLNGKRGQFKGTKTYSTPMVFPRSGMYIDGATTEYPVTTVPPEIKAAQIQLVIAQQAGIALDSPSVGGVLPIIREKVDVLETEYATPAMMGAMTSTAWLTDDMPAVDALLAPFLSVLSGFRVFRV